MSNSVVCVPKALLEQGQNWSPVELLAAIWALYEQECPPSDQPIRERVRLRLGVTESTMATIAAHLMQVGVDLPAGDVLKVDSRRTYPQLNGFPGQLNLTPPPILLEQIKSKAPRKQPVWQPYFDRLLSLFGQTDVYRSNPSNRLWNQWRKAAKDFAEFRYQDKPLDLNVLDRCYKKCVDAKFPSFGPGALLNRLPDVLASEDRRQSFTQQAELVPEPAAPMGEPVDPFFARRVKRSVNA